MYILAIETTGPFGSVALIDQNNQILGFEESTDTMNHLKDLMPMVKKVLAKNNLKGEELTAVACSVGPGSFTGIRIGVSTARALAQAWGIKTVACSSLLAFIEGAEAVGKDTRCVIFNARRRQVYGVIEGILPEGPYMIDDITEIITGKREGYDKLSRVVFYGDGIDAYHEIIARELDNQGVNCEFAPKQDRYQNAGNVARAALTKARNGQFTDFCDLLPNYMRKAEAEEKLKAGELPICKLPKQE